MGSVLDEAGAIKFKDEGNKAYAAHDWPAAIELYSKAIDLNPNEASFWSNRAQVSCNPGVSHLLV